MLVVKQLFVFALILLAGLGYRAEAQTPQQPEAQEAVDSLKVYNKVDEAPRFGEGSNDLALFTTQNLNYPKKAAANGEQGMVVVRFIVERDGTLSSIQVVRSVSKALDEEALRIVKIMPKWIPAKVNGQSVRSRMVLPVGFRING